MSVPLRNERGAVWLDWKGTRHKWSRPEAKAGTRLRDRCLDGCYGNRHQTDMLKERRAPRNWWLTLGSFSKPRRRRQRERHQTKGLMSRTIAVHVRFESLYISLPSSAKQQREMTRFYVFWRTGTAMANFWYLL